MICKANRGRYGVPIPIKQININWMDEDGNKISAPKEKDCEHPHHWMLGKGRRNGQKLKYPLEEMYVQKWELSEKEFKEAIDQFDMFSLDMPIRIICGNCKKNE